MITCRMSLLSWIILLAVVLFCRSAETNDVLPSVQRTPVVIGQGYFPVVLRLADGRIAVVMRGGAPHIGIEGRLDMVFSDDEGKTWSTPTVVNNSPVDDRNPALGQAPNGDLVVALWRTATYDDRGRYDESLDKLIQLLVTRSADGGKSWFKPTEVDVSDIGAGNPYGKNWSKPTRLASGSVHPADIRVLGDGHPLLVTGYRLKPYGVRGVSGDLKSTFDWQDHFVLVNDAVNTDCGDPSSVVLKDGRVLTVYYAVGSKQHPEWRVHCGSVVFGHPTAP